MSFNDFINNLSKEDKENYDYFSQIRGVQQYKIIFETLYKIDSNVTYQDVNAFVIYDKGLKNKLYIFLGSLEEYIKVYIFANYDLKKGISLKEEYTHFDDLRELIEERKSSLDEKTELYKRYKLNFKGMIDILKKFDDRKFNLDELNQIRNLRNEVMHHLPLLFDVDGTNKAKKTEELIEILIKTLPLNYPIYLSNKLNEKTKTILDKININYNKLVLKIF